MEYTDRTLNCSDCNGEFTFTAGEQEFYAQKGFDNEPKRCPDCREKHKDERRSSRPQTQITCSNCGKEDTVPFVPSGDRPVLCRDCFAQSKS